MRRVAQRPIFQKPFYRVGEPYNDYFQVSRELMRAPAQVDDPLRREFLDNRTGQVD